MVWQLEKVGRWKWMISGLVGLVRMSIKDFSWVRVTYVVEVVEGEGVGGG